MWKRGEERYSCCREAIEDDEEEDDQMWEESPEEEGGSPSCSDAADANGAAWLPGQVSTAKFLSNKYRN